MSDQVGKVCKSGDACPISGIWEVVSPNSASFLIKEGEIFPQYEGKDISWVFVVEKRD